MFIINITAAIVGLQQLKIIELAKDSTLLAVTMKLKEQGAIKEMAMSLLF